MNQSIVPSDMGHVLALHRICVVNICNGVWFLTFDWSEIVTVKVEYIRLVISLKPEPITTPAKKRCFVLPLISSMGLAIIFLVLKYYPRAVGIGNYKWLIFNLSNLTDFWAFCKHLSFNDFTITIFLQILFWLKKFFNILFYIIFIWG